jgi:CheY-like chemotaxis protein
MRLEQLTPAHIRRAVSIYLEIAWPAGSPGSPRITENDLAGLETVEQIFERCDKPPARSGNVSPRYSLRLGNCRYPFMKFVVQEYLVDREYFFEVDTHDDLDIKRDNPDYQGWQEIKGYNRDLKQRIEAAWVEADLPTHSDLKHLAEDLARVEREGEKRARLLVVDDDQNVAKSLEALFRARGYEVEVAYDGRQVLERLNVDPLPDLVLLDYSMPELDGEEVLSRIRANPRLEGVVVLLATASSIDLKRLQNVSGMLRKPYPRDVLYTMVTRLLAAREQA